MSPTMQVRQIVKDISTDWGLSIRRIGYLLHDRRPGRTVSLEDLYSEGQPFSRVEPTAQDVADLTFVREQLKRTYALESGRCLA